MYRKRMFILVALLLIATTFCGCSSSNSNEKPTSNIKTDANVKQEPTIQPIQSVNNQSTQSLNYPTPDFSNLKDVILFKYQFVSGRAVCNIYFAKEYRSIWADTIKNNKDFKTLINNKRSEYGKVATFITNPEDRFMDLSTYGNMGKKVLGLEIQSMQAWDKFSNEKDSLPLEYKQAYDIVLEMQKVLGQTDYYTAFPFYNQFTYEQFSKQLDEMENKFNELNNKYNTLNLPINKYNLRS